LPTVDADISTFVLAALLCGTALVKPFGAPAVIFKVDLGWLIELFDPSDYMAEIYLLPDRPAI
jgi:hypothetical protein